MQIDLRERAKCLKLVKQLKFIQIELWSARFKTNKSLKTVIREANEYKQKRKKKEKRVLLASNGEMWH